jgi:predicted metal-binding protein
LIDPNGTTTATRDASACIYVCITCRANTTPADGTPADAPPDDTPRTGALLADATAKAAAGTGVTVRPIRCLANCSRGPSAALRSNGSWTYIFGGLGVDCAAALIEGARLLAGAADGILPWRGRPDVLKRGLIARVPPIDFEDISS